MFFGGGSTESYFGSKESVKMGIISRIGCWFDKKFPDKMTVEEVLLHFKIIESKMESKVEEQKRRADELDAKIGDLQSDMKANKAGLKNLSSQKKMEAQMIQGPQPTEGWAR